MLISVARLRPDRVVDILKACGALDLSSSLSRDVNLISHFLLFTLFILLPFISIFVSHLIPYFVSIFNSILRFYAVFPHQFSSTLP